MTSKKIDKFILFDNNKKKPIRSKKMTTCIATLSDNGAGCVLVSDQMTTAHFPIGYEFENDEVQKIIPVADQIYVLLAGDVIFANKIIENAKNKCRNSEPKNIQTFVEYLRTSYQQIRIQHVIQTELEPRGLTLDSFYQIQQKLNPAIVQMVDQALKGFSPGVELIVAGKDESGCHIYSVLSPGITSCHDAVGFIATGSGGPHAVYSIIGSQYKKSFEKDKVREIVLAAKKQSEVAPGVGKQTKIVEI